MADAKALQQRLARGEIVLLDGAIGTELERLGAPMHDDIWCGHALETHPDLVAEVHRSYIAAGADVITANTYATARHALAPAGMGGRTEAWNRLAMDLATGARREHAGDRAVWVAGSVSTFGAWEGLTAAQIKDSLAEQARILVDAGADLLILETLASSPEIVMTAIDSAAGLGVPVWVAVSCMQDAATGQLMHGVRESARHGGDGQAFAPLADVASALSGMPADALLMMHSELSVATAAVEVLRAGYQGPVGVYPNAGYWKRPEWAFVDQVSPDAFLTHARQWAAAGAQIIGGCCGIGPEHIRAFSAGLPEPARQAD